MTDGSFSPAAREAIYEATMWRCAACGRTDLTAQHRRARGMGGTSKISIGHPANGIALCGSGTTGCHGWVEHHPVEAELLGYRLAPGTHALGSPWWNRSYHGWWAWAEEPATPGHRPFVFIRFAHNLDRPQERAAALLTLQAARRPTTTR